MSKKNKIAIQDENDPITVDGLANESAEITASSPPASDEPVRDETTSPDGDLTAKLEAAEKEGRDHYDRLLRVSAEFDNYKKRTSREMQELAKYATEKLLKELLSIVDNLERAIASCEHDPDQPDPVLQGVNLTLGEMLNLLERHHVTPVKSLGESFDPAFHQAMMQEEVEGQPANRVVREMQKGYLLHDRLLRPALVAVSKTRDKQSDNLTNNLDE